jgi:ankyrin repeat protein
MVELPIAHNPDVNHGDDLWGFKPLHYATQANHSLVVKRLLVAGAKPLVTVNEGVSVMVDGARNVSALYLACTSDAVDSLIEMIPYIPPEKLIYALRYAIDRNKPAAVEAILASPYLNNGVDIFHKNNAGETILHTLAKRITEPELLPKIITEKEQVRAEVKKLRIGDLVDAFKLLMDMGLDARVEDNTHRTPLDVAAACGNVEILELFRDD